MIYEYDLKKVLVSLKGPRREILDSEMAVGNDILEISRKWPMPEVNVWFKNPLTDKYEKSYPSLQYSFLGDPRNWLEET